MTTPDVNFRIEVYRSEQGHVVVQVAGPGGAQSIQIPPDYISALIAVLGSTLNEPKGGTRNGD